MSWAILIVAGMCEAVWALALSRSRGFTRLVPSLVFLVFLVLAMVLLAVAMREIPTGTAYAVWVAIGATLTAAIAMARREEPATAARVGLLVLLVACVVGLKVVS